MGIRLWDIDTGRCIQTFQATPRIRCVTFSRNGQIIASCGDDSIVRLWDINTGECLRSLQGHTGLVYSVAFCSNDHILVSSGNELIIWDINAAQHQILDGHSNWIFSVAFSPDGQTLASGSQDETIRLWSTNTGECLGVLRPDRPYEGMNITGATGLINGQKEMLQALGAIEDEM
ncbi:WD40 repeat domain-containing protein [Mastigocladus laminosus UU774]|nr:WD40 repeat domain-containing protein [Mastigocladus laminosus UU774]